MRTSGSHEISVSSHWCYKLPKARNLGGKLGPKSAEVGFTPQALLFGVSRILGRENKM